MNMEKIQSNHIRRILYTFGTSNGKNVLRPSRVRIAGEDYAQLTPQALRVKERFRAFIADFKLASLQRGQPES